jgi:hypothetical protein
MKSGNLNFLEPSGPLQARNGTALPFILYILLQRANSDKNDCIDQKWNNKNSAEK